MPRYGTRDRDDYDFDRPMRRRRRSRGSGLPKLGPVAIALGIAVLLIFLSFAIRGAGLVLLWLGVALMVVGNLWFYVVALSDGIGQFLLCFFIPFYSLFYLIMNWEETKYPFGVNLLGVFILFGCLIAGAAREGISSDDPSREVAKEKEKENGPDSLRDRLKQKERPKEEPKSAPSADPNDPANPTRPFDVDPQAKAAGQTIYLAVLKPFAYKQGPWKYAVGATGASADEPIKVQGKEYKYGISACPPDSTVESCRVSFVPGGEFKRLKGWGALNEYVFPPWGKTVFTIHGDGKKLWESEPLNKSNTMTGFDIDVTGVKVLTLETRVKEGSHLHGHAVWLDPWLER